MKNPTRRNRNIGTEKQGHGQNNELTIPYPVAISKTFYERLGRYEKFNRTINGNVFEFVIEETRTTSEHACTIEDISEIIRHIPPSDYDDLNLIILRQPKRKEETLSSVWGRLIYSYEFEGNNRAAIILEAVDYERKFKWSKSLQPEHQKELERLRSDGHEIIAEKRYYTAEYKLDNVRNTQLYRTLPHEFGHYVHYLEEVERPGTEEEDYEEWELRYDNYFKISTADKEKFAHGYADELINNLKECRAIPFERIENPSHQKINRHRADLQSESSSVSGKSAK